VFWVVWIKRESLINKGLGDFKLNVKIMDKVRGEIMKEVQDDIVYKFLG